MFLLSLSLYFYTYICVCVCVYKKFTYIKSTFYFLPASFHLIESKLKLFNDKNDELYTITVYIIWIV